MAIDLSVNQPEGLFGLVALITVITVWFVFALLLRWIRWRGLDSQERETVARMRQQLANWSPETVTIPRRDRDELDRWHDRLLARSQGVGGGQAGVFEALGEVRAALAAHLGPVPRLSIYLGSEAAALSLAVGAVIASAPALRAALQRADVGPVTALSKSIDAVVTSVEILWGAFPGTNVIWALLTVLVLQMYTWLSSNAIEVAALLLGLAVLVGVVDQYVRIEGDRRLYPRRRRLLARIGGWLAVIYAAGALPAVAGERLGAAGLGATVGGLLAFGAMLFGLSHAAAESHRRLRGTASLEDVGVGLVPKRWSAVHRDRIAYWYLVLRRVALVAGLVALPVVVYYVGLAVVRGHVPRLVAALFAAPLPLQLGVVLLAVTVVVMTIGSARAAWAEVADAVTRAAQQQSVRVAVFVSLGPLVTGLVTVTLLLAFGVGLLWAAFAAALLAVLVRLGYRAWQFAAYKAHTREPTPGLRSVTVAGPTRVELPTEDIWVARVNAAELAWPTVEGLVDDAIATVDARFDEDDHGPQPAEAYFEWVEDTGEVDIDDFESGLSAEARSRFVELIQETSGRITEVDERLRKEYGEALAAAARTTERELGRVSKDDRFYRLHEASLDG